jgi:branched-chain amino acid transport system permease protein
MLFQNIVMAITSGQTYSVNSAIAAQSVAIGSVRTNLARIIVLGAASLITFVLACFLKWAKLGKSIRAVAQDRRAAQTLGINVERTYMISFGIGTALAGIAGVLLVPLYTMSPQIGSNFIMPAFAVVVLGGLGSVLGAYIGGFIVGLTEAFAGAYLGPDLKNAVLFLVFILVLIVRPSGLFGHAGAEEVGLREQS